VERFADRRPRPTSPGFSRGHHENERAQTQNVAFNDVRSSFVALAAVTQQLQQTGMLFMQTQQTQPDSVMVAMHSQQA
jgi:hypothetical protein